MIQYIQYMNNKSDDLNSIILRDNHGKMTINRIVRSRFILSALLILSQLMLFIYFIIRLQKYIQYYFIVSAVFSVSFMMYMANRHERNEFKIAWFIPLMIFPLCGIAFYYLYHTDTGERRAKKALEISKKQVRSVVGPLCTDGKLQQEYPEIRDLQTYLERQGFPPYKNNRIDYLSSGESFFADFMNALKNAEKYIFIETFILKVEESWVEILKVLEEKAKEGVEVRVMYDAFGSQLASARTYVRFLESKHIKVCIFNPMIPVFTTRQNSRNHRKIYIIDGTSCYCGGLNIANEYFNCGSNRFSYWKDNAVKISGEAVKSFTMMFLQDWNMQMGCKNPDKYGDYLNISYEKYDTPGIAVPYGDDSYNNEDIAENVYLYLVNTARKYIHITSPYVLLDAQFMEALLFAAKRGIEVKLVVPSVPDHFITFCIGKTFLKTLVDNGIEVYLYRNGFIHAKTFVVDDVTATVGSINLDYRSFFHHFECGLVLHASPVIADIEKDFQDMVNDSDEMKTGDYEKLPLIQRIVGRSFKVFAPLM